MRKAAVAAVLAVAAVSPWGGACAEEMSGGAGNVGMGDGYAAGVSCGAEGARNGVWGEEMREQGHDAGGNCGSGEEVRDGYVDSVQWRIEGDTLRIWGRETDSWRMVFNIRRSAERAKVRCLVMEEGVTTVADNLLSGIETLESVQLPEGLRRIGEGAFKNSGLRGRLVLPEGLTEIGAEAFAGCKGVDGVQLPQSLRRIGKEAFAECGLRELVLPEGVQEIGEYAFNGCYYIKHVTVLCDGKGIDRDAFYGCYMPDGGIESVVLGDGVRTINVWEISVEGLKELYVSAGVEDFLGPGHLDRETKVTVAEGNRRYKMKEGVLYDMRDSVVLKCETEKRGRVVIPEWVRRVGDYAFDGCVRITEVEMPCVREIGFGAFRRCKGLKRVRMGNSVESIGWWAFSGCRAIEEMNVPRGVIIGHAAFEECEKWRGDVVIEAYVSSEAFRGCQSLRSVVLGEQVKEIERYAFAGCKSLKEIVVPDSVRRIGDSAFEDCSGVKRMVLPKGQVVRGYSVFSGMTGLEEVVTGDSMLWSDGTLYDMRDSTLLVYTGGGGVRLPEWVRRIDGGAFSHNNRIRKVAVPKGIISPGIGAFEGCMKLEEAVVDCERVGDGMFCGCKRLRSVTLTDRVKFVGSQAFEDCDSMKEIILPACIDNVSSGAFEDCDSLLRIEVAKGKCHKVVDDDPIEIDELTIISSHIIVEDPEPRDKEYPVYEYVSYDGVLYRKKKNGGLDVVAIPEGKRGTWVLPTVNSVDVKHELFEQAVRQFSRIKCMGGSVPKTRTHGFTFQLVRPERITKCVLEVPDGMRKKFERKEIDGKINWWSLFDKIVESGEVEALLRRPCCVAEWWCEKKEMGCGACKIHAFHKCGHLPFLRKGR